MPSLKKALLCVAVLSAGTAYGADSYQIVTKVPGLTKAAEPEPEISFETISFTNCGMSGRTGPSDAQCRSEYNGSPILNPALSFSVASGIQSWTVPHTASYKIESWGAQGGSVGGYGGGRGAKAEKTVALSAGDKIRVLVGQVGIGAGYGAGGGGGSFVVRENSPLVIAGGGGGATSARPQFGFPGLTSSSGGNSSASGGICSSGGFGGYDGQGGTGGCAAGGAGWLGNGSIGIHRANGGVTFTSGGVGGLSTNTYGTPGGGFGGGGAGSPNVGFGGGGGGYSGGGGGDYSNSRPGNGGGGGSLGDNNVTGANTGHGRVVISLVK